VHYSRCDIKMELNLN